MEVQYHCKSSSHHYAALRQGYKCNSDEKQHGRRFRTTVGVRQGCLLSSTLFNTFLQELLTDALEEQGGKFDVGGRNFTTFRFADDIYAVAEKEQKIEALVDGLDKTCPRYKMEINAKDKQR